MEDLTLNYIGLGVACFCFFGALTFLCVLLADVVNDKKTPPKKAQN